jgi:hypothetical protein
VDGAGIEPAASAMPTLRSSRLIYPPVVILNRAGKLLSIMGRSQIHSQRSVSVAATN